MRREYRLFCVILCIFLNLQFVCSWQSDSLFVENILNESSSISFGSRQEKLLFFAEKLQGIPYCGGTLDSSAEERLIVRTDSLDCTTYVETVLALYLASDSEFAASFVSSVADKYHSFCSALQYIRYRGGEISGYTSRLHYFTDWVCDNSMKGILCELTNEMEHKTKSFSLDYMTSHYELYPLLKGNTDNIERMKNVERKWAKYKMPYIPKDKLLSDKSELDIENGDIIALATSIEGLDVVHLGFAYWQNNQLHLLHASSVHKEVVLDKESLYEYLMKRKKHIGIRVIRINK